MKNICLAPTGKISTPLMTPATLAQERARAAAVVLYTVMEENQLLTGLSDEFAGLSQK